MIGKCRKTFLLQNGCSCVTLVTGKAVNYSRVICEYKRCARIKQVIGNKAVTVIPVSEKIPHYTYIDSNRGKIGNYSIKQISLLISDGLVSFSSFNSSLIYEVTSLEKLWRELHVVNFQQQEEQDSKTRAETDIAHKRYN